MASGKDFGAAVGVSASLGVVGAPGEDTYGTDAGAAFLFDLVTGRMLHILRPDDQLAYGQVGAKFGHSTALAKGSHVLDASLNFVIIGAPFAFILGANGGNRKTGAAYLFHAANGTQAARLVADNGAINDEFGYSVAMHGGLAVVGARKHEANGVEDAGVVYIFDCATARQLRQVAASDAQPLALFGHSISVHAQYMVVGAPRRDRVGAAYIFNIASGVQHNKLIPPAEYTAVDASFGLAVDISNGAALIGSPGVSLDTGVAHLFHNSVSASTTVTSYLSVYLPQPGDFFGRAVAIEANDMVITAPGAKSRNGFASGYAMLVDVDAGTAIQQVAPDGEASDNLGFSAAISDAGNFMIGSRVHVNAGASSSLNGAAYQFRVRPLSPPSASPLLPAAPLASGLPPVPSPLAPPATDQIFIVFGSIAAGISGILLIVMLATVIVSRRAGSRGGAVLPPPPAADSVAALTTKEAALQNNSTERIPALHDLHNTTQAWGSEMAAKGDPEVNRAPRRTRRPPQPPSEYTIVASLR